MKLLALLLVLLPSLAVGQDYIVAGPRPRAAAATVNMQFAGVRSEPGTDWDDSGGLVQYSTLLSDSADFANDEGSLFDVIGVTGQLCDLTISQKNGTLDAADAGAVVTVRLLSGGDVSAGGWADTALAVTITSDNGTSDVSWTDSDCIDVVAGDAVALEWDLTTVSSTTWDDGEHEAPENSVEFRSASGDFFVPANMIQGTAFQAQYAWGMGGSDINGVVDEDNCTAADTPYDCCTGSDAGTCSELRGVPVPGSFTFKGIRASFEADPDADRTMYVCQDDVGTDGNCDTIGTQIASCVVDVAGASTCSSTGLSVSLTDGNRLFLRSTGNDANNWRGVSLIFSNSSQQWFSVMRRGVHTANTIAYGLNAGDSLTMCNQFTAEDPQCMPRIPNGMTATSMTGWLTEAVTDSSGSDATFTVALRESAVTGLNCVFAHASQTCADTGSDGTFDAQDFVSHTSVPANGLNNADAFFAVSTLWNSLP